MLTENISIFAAALEMFFLRFFNETVLLRSGIYEALDREISVCYPRFLRLSIYL